MFTRTSLPGCSLVAAPVVRDHRGIFTKPFEHQSFRNHGVSFDIKELFWSRSVNRTLRGMHFQVPPFAASKLVWCVEGEVIDVVLDVRIESPAYAVSEGFRLSADSGLAVLIPPGVAHGFYVLSPEAVVAYAVTAAYSPEHDKGILWRSIGYEWPDPNPVLSDRDQAFPALEEFRSPFLFPQHPAPEIAPARSTRIEQ